MINSPRFSWQLGGVTDQGKCFYNTAFDLKKEDGNRTMMHFLWTYYNGIAIPPFNIDGNPVIGQYEKVKSSEQAIQINHYWSRSYVEYFNKRNKGRAATIENPLISNEHFYRFEEKNISQDYSMLKYIIRLKENMGLTKDINENKDR